MYFNTGFVSYSVKIQSNIKHNWYKKHARKSQIVERVFFLKKNVWKFFPIIYYIIIKYGLGQPS